MSDSGAWGVKARNAALIIAGADILAAEQKVLDLIAASPLVECFATRECQIRSPREHNLCRAARRDLHRHLRTSGSEIDLIAHNFMPAVYLCGPKARLLLGFTPRSGEGASHVVETLAPYQ